MATVESLEELATWEQAWADQAAGDAGHLLIFKRSPICPGSISAEREFDHFVDKREDVPSLRIMKVNVISGRPISQRIAADTQVKHESPQALLIGAKQEIQWNASHHAITSGALAQALT